MPKKLSVLLLEDVSGIGRSGDIVMVSEGFARNSLFPEGKAALGTAEVKTRHAHEQAKLAREKAQQIEVWQKQAELLDGTELTLTAKVKQGETIFGSLSKKHIVSELNSKAKLSLPEKAVVVAAPIKRLGSYDMTIKFSPEVECVMKVTVVPDPSSVKAAPEDE